MRKVVQAEWRQVARLLEAMKAYVLSLCVGVLVGAIYGVLGVRSPAPPVIALLGLLGMLLGEQGVASRDVRSRERA